MKTKKIIALYCILSIVFISLSPIFAKKADAFLGIGDVTFTPLSDVINTVTSVNTTALVVKEFGLDTIAYIIANAILERIAASTVNWINNGFQGSPAFITDPGQYFGNLADGVAGQLIYSNPNFNFMCSPFRAKVQIAINRAYINNNGQFQCSLTKIANNFDGFINDFNQGGWDGFIELSQGQSNPISLYNNWLSEINTSVASAKNQKQQELQQGNGFLSYQTCTDLDSAKFNACRIGGGTVAGCQAQAQKCTTQTPGSVIQTQLNGVLSSGNDRLKVADEINEIISALLNQLLSKAIGGLRSLSSGGGGSNQAYTGQLENASANDPNVQNAISGANGSISAGGNTINNNASPCQLPDGSIGISRGSGPCTAPLIPGSTSTGGTAGTGSSGSPFPITAKDGSTISSRPSDPSCTNAQPQDILNAATEIYSHPSHNPTVSTIATIAQGLICNADGTVNNYPFGGSGLSSLPITAQDGSIVNFWPEDRDCDVANISDIVARGTAICYANAACAAKTGGNNIANTIKVMDCTPGGILPPIR